MKQEVLNFFKDTIGYNGKTWNLKHEGNGYAHAWFLHDMEEMIRSSVGYPSLLYLMNMQAFLGYCTNFQEGWKIPVEAREKQKEFEDAGKKVDFLFFCNSFLSSTRDEYKDEYLTGFLFDTLRHRLSHVYFITHILTTIDAPKDHLTIKEKSGKMHLFISVKTYFEETKMAIEELFEQVSNNNNLETFFKDRQQFLADFATTLDQNYLRGQKLEKDNFLDVLNSLEGFVSLSAEDVSSRISAMPGVSANFPKTPEEVQGDSIDKMFKNIK